MKYNCELIEDILPLYVENMVSDNTKVIIQDHLKECNRCREKYMIMQQGEIPSSAPKVNDFQMLKSRILFEIILSVIVEFIALMFLFKYVLITNGYIYIVFSIFVFLPLISFLCCFHIADKGLKENILLILTVTIVSAATLVGSRLYQINLAGDHEMPSGWLYVVGGSFGLIPALIGTIAKRCLIWKRRLRK